MRGAVYHGPRDVRVEDVDDPGAPGRDQIRLRVTRAAICGTDAAEFEHGPHLIPLRAPHPGSGHSGPLIMGHEFTGRVEAVGDAVKGLEVGQSVVPGAGVWCGRCVACRSGRTNLCQRYYTLGLQADGGLADYVITPGEMCSVVPDGCSPEAAAMAQPMAVALHASRRGGIQADTSVAVIGVGGIGFFVLAAALFRGAADVIAVDVDDERLTRARSFGASQVVRGDAEDSGHEVIELTRGRGADVVVEASGAPPAPALAQQVVRKGGTVVLLGLHEKPVPFDVSDLVLREVNLVASVAHVCDIDLPESLRALSDESLAKAALDRVVDLDDLVPAGLDPLARGEISGKVVVNVGEDGS